MKNKSILNHTIQIAKFLLLLLVCIGFQSCVNSKTMKQNKFSKGSYGYDKEFLSNHLEITELKNGEASLITVPAYQGRVMTSTCEGDKGFSFGWINHDLIKSKKINDHFNPFGGEERFWLGPEGGQYSIYFKKETAFDIKNWYVPAGIDTDEFEVVEKSAIHVSFEKKMKLQNYSGFNFKLSVKRDITLLDQSTVQKYLGLSEFNAKVVGYESRNTIVNSGQNDWSKETGLLSIWMLGMLTPSPEVTVVIPVKNGDLALLGEKVNDNYFGKISDDRLKVKGDIVFFKADGKSRGKIGISPKRSTKFSGSYDGENMTLTILECLIPENRFDYVNSAWELQDDPYSGDVINSYNDGPLEDGSQMGPFYELEASSPALNLKVSESYTHTQRTYHFKGTVEELSLISKPLLGVTIMEIREIF